jgi:Fibrinogen beta and gamma chains, C-terminal globular domain
VSCNAILAAGNSTGNGVYVLQQPGSSAYQAYCDMTDDGGGWTAMFDGVNGEANVFDHFDADYYAGTCTDPQGRCMRRGPTSIIDSNTDLAVACGSAMVKFAMTNPSYDLLTAGTQGSWINLNPTSIGATTAATLPTLFWTGSGADTSFIFSTAESANANTFASSFNYQASTGWDYCNDAPDHASTLRLFYREAQIAAPLNTQATAGTSCYAILNAGQSLGTGNYWLQQAGGQPYEAYCDMVTDGGGWTTIFAGRNGSYNTFDTFDRAADTCTDPATHCVRRAPTTLSESVTEVGVWCGNVAVRFPATQSIYNYLTAGTRSSWQAIAGAQSIGAGNIAVLPDEMYTGNGADPGFMINKDEVDAETFISAYDTSASWDFCNGSADNWSPIRIAYREGPPPTNPNAQPSCLAVLDAGLSTGSGLYLLQQPGGSAYEAYCDMTDDGGGWTAMFDGVNGEANVFDHFDSDYYAGTCTDPQAKCMRRGPASIANSAVDLAVACGGAMVKFAMTNPSYDLLTAGTQASWINVNPTSIGTTPAAILPNLFWTGSGADTSFILSTAEAATSKTFASSFNYQASTGWDYCNGTADHVSTLRLFYREYAAEVPYNTAATAGSSCKAILNAGGSQGDGVYWILPPGVGTAYQAYCDMTHDGGGWTAALTGRNGSYNTFDRFDAGAYQGICTDPATRCLHRIPAGMNGVITQLAVACNNAMVEFPVTNAMFQYLSAGTEQSWVAIGPSTSIGTSAVPHLPTDVYTGNNGDRGFMVGNETEAQTFGTTYNTNALWDYCNATADDWSFLRVYYR